MRGKLVLFITGMVGVSELLYCKMAYLVTFTWNNKILYEDKIRKLAGSLTKKMTL